MAEPSAAVKVPAVSAPAIPKRKHKKRRAKAVEARGGKNGALRFRPLVVNDDRLEDFKPPLPPLDPLAAAQEEAQHAKAGNVKLARAVDILREGLELLVVAEVDRKTGVPVNALTLRKLAAATLDRYSAHSGQNWRSPKNKLTGATRAGDRSIPDDLDREEA